MLQNVKKQSKRSRKYMNVCLFKVDLGIETQTANKGQLLFTFLYKGKNFFQVKTVL